MGKASHNEMPYFAILIFCLRNLHINLYLLKAICNIDIFYKGSPYYNKENWSEEHEKVYQQFLKYNNIKAPK